MRVYCDDIEVFDHRATSRLAHINDETGFMDQENLPPLTLFDDESIYKLGRGNERFYSTTKLINDTNYDASVSELTDSDSPLSSTRSSSDSSSIKGDEHRYEVTRQNVLTAAHRLIDNLNVHKRPAPDPEDASDKRHYAKGPVKRKRTSPKKPKEINTSTKHIANICDSPSGLPTPPFSGKSSPKSPSDKRRVSNNYPKKLLEDFPLPSEPLPAGLSLEDLCLQYPNHLFGEHLQRLVRQKWGASKIYEHLPPMDHLDPSDRITIRAITARVTKARKELEQTSQLEGVLNISKTNLGVDDFKR